MSLERQMYSKEECEEILKRYKNAKAKCELNILMVKLYNQQIEDFQKEDSQRARRGESIFRDYKEGVEKIIPRDKEKLETSLNQLSDMFVSSIYLWPAIFSEIETVPEDKLISMFVEWMKGEKFIEALEFHYYEFEDITLPLILSDFVRYIKAKQ